jgi:hypothetical protein
MAQGGSGGSAEGGAGGAIPNSGDCDSDDDCPGGTCVELTPGGFRVCATPPTEATMCTGSGFDSCCTTAECAEGICYESPLVPFCAGVVMEPHNECGVDQCAKDADCMNGESGGACVPAGALGFKVAACISAACRHDTDCADEPGGICATIEEPCCGTTAGLFCVYPSDGCRTSSECADGYCSVNGDRTECVAGQPLCPA